MTEATVQSIDANAKQMTLSFTDSYTCTESDTIRTKEKIAEGFAFGSQPKLYDTFYIGSKEAFSKREAKISLTFSLRLMTNQRVLCPLQTRSWPGNIGTARDGRRSRSSETRRPVHERFLGAGDMKIVQFICPAGIQETEVFGQKNYWIRTRIIGGDYGREQYTLGSDNEINVSRKFKLPVIRHLTAQYAFDESIEPEACLSYNNLDFEDITVQARTAESHLQPVHSASG